MDHSYCEALSINHYPGWGSEQSITSYLGSDLCQIFQIKIVSAMAHCYHERVTRGLTPSTIPCHKLSLTLVNDWNGDLWLVNDKNGAIWLANSKSLGHKECLEMKLKEGLWLCMFICKVRGSTTNRTSLDHGHQTVTRTQPPVYNPCFTIPNGLLQILQSVSKQRYSRITAECLGF